jgi:hypothetical protein
MKRGPLLLAMLAATLALSAYLALQPALDEMSTAQVVPVRVRGGRRPPPPDATPPQLTQGQRGWTALEAEALASWSPPPPAATPAARSASAAAEAASTPRAPPFPYKWIGRLEQDGSAVALLDGPQRSLGASAGQVLDGQWRIDRVGEERVEITWLPGDERVALNKR